METLTRVLAKRVYNLDLNNLPLDKLSGARNRRVIRTANKISNIKVDSRQKHERTFSRGWERSDSQSPRGTDEPDKSDRNRMNTVGSRDDLDRLKQRVPYMRSVSSREEAAAMISNMKQNGRNGETLTAWSSWFCFGSNCCYNVKGVQTVVIMLRVFK